MIVFFCVVFVLFESGVMGFVVSGYEVDVLDVDMGELLGFGV